MCRWQAQTPVLLSHVQNDKYYRRFPGDVAAVQKLVRHLAALPDGSAQLPAGSVLTPRCDRGERGRLALLPDRCPLCLQSGRKPRAAPGDAAVCSTCMHVGSAKCRVMFAPGVRPSISDVVIAGERHT